MAQREARWRVGLRLSTRLPADTKALQIVELDTGQEAWVDTIKVADDGRDAKAVVVVLGEEDSCPSTVNWWDGEYEGECNLPAAHPGNHADGLSAWDDEGNQRA